MIPRLPRPIAATVIVLFLVAFRADAQAPMHPSQPTVNLGDTSFLDAVAGPGFLVEEIVDGYHASHAYDSDGAQVPNSSGTYSISGITHVAWLSKKTVWGAWFGAEILQAVAHVNAGQGKVATGAGDLTFAPLILQWRERKLRSFQVAQRIVFDFDLPTGQYKSSAPLNLSAHHFDVHPYYAVTFFLFKRIESSWRVHYLWNATDGSPPAGTNESSTQAGQAIHFNATAGYRITHGLWIGANGYLLEQITKPQINGRPISNSPERIGAIGPGAAWDLGHWILFANAYHEIGALNRPEGNRLVLRVQWIPGRKGCAPSCS